MHERTTELYDELEALKLPEAERRRLVSVTDGEAGELRGMNRKQRRAWLSQQRKAGRKFARFPASNG